MKNAFEHIIFNRKVQYRFIILFFAFISFATGISAEISVSAHSGYTLSGYREETYSTILQYADAIPANIEARFRGKVLEHSILTNFSFAKNSSAVSEKRYLLESFDEYTGKKESRKHKETIYSISSFFQYGLTGKLFVKNNAVSRLGGFFRIDTDIQFANYPSVTVITGIGPLYEHGLTLSPKDRLLFSTQVALAAWAVRPPYAGADAQLMNLAATNPMAIVGTGSLVLPDKYRSVIGTVTYYRAISTHVELLTSIQAYYSYISVPLPRAETGISFTVGANANF